METFILGNQLKQLLAGTYFRGYVNREMKVHGHDDVPESGSVGLQIQGNGSVFISQIEMTKL